jgi:CheY-like chemotaxis protein
VTLLQYGELARETVRVLHIEDSPSDAEIVRRLLSRLGATRFVVETATSAEEALSRLASGRYDLIFLDNGLPDENGLDLLRRVGTLGAPVIMLTAQEEIRQDALDAGAAGFLAKAGLDSEALSRVISAVIGPFPGGSQA